MDSEEKNDIDLIKTLDDTIVKNQDDNQDYSQGGAQEDNQNKSEVKCKKISEVEKKDRISLDEDTFEFSCTLKDGYLYLTLSEIGALSPFIYQRKLSHDDFKKIHQVFISCEDVEEIKTHIDRLFEQNKICISGKNGEDSLVLNLKIAYFANKDERPIEVYKIMTDKKDETLEALYKIQKNDIKVFKDIKKSLETHGQRDALKIFNDLVKLLKK